MRLKRALTAVVAVGTFVIGAAAVAPTASASSITQVERLGGVDAIDTSVKVSQALWRSVGDPPDPDAAFANAVVLTRNDHFGDGLVGAPLAERKQGPLLLTSPNFLSGGAEDEIRRVLPTGKTVYILGGTAAVSVNVENRLRALGYQVTRLWGNTQYETAVSIADAANTAPEYIFVATGREYYDALSAGATAAASNGVVLLSDGPNLPWAVYDYINRHPSATILGVGGPAVDALQYGPRDYYALSGDDAIDTAIQVANAWDGPQYTGIAAMSGYHDAMSGGALAASVGGPVLLSGQSALDWRSYAYLNRNSADLLWVDVYGGTLALSPKVETDARNAVGAGAAPSLTARSAAPAAAQPRVTADKPTFKIPAGAQPTHVK